VLVVKSIEALDRTSKETPRISATAHSKVLQAFGREATLKKRPKQLQKKLPKGAQNKLRAIVQAACSF